MGELILCIEEFQFETSYDDSRCRICHEEEFESALQLEAPCACSGTIKFAHRDCIQKWCSEKGSTICEICLQNYEPGYTATFKKPQLADPSISVQIRRSEQEEAAEPASPPADGGASDHACSSTADRGAFCCKSVALTDCKIFNTSVTGSNSGTVDIFTLVLLVRHFYDVVAVGSAEYPFTLATVLVLKASGIIFPMYVITRTIDVIKNYICRNQYPDHYDLLQDSDDDDDSSFEDDDRRQHHIL